TRTSEAKGHWQAYGSSAAFRFEVPKRACGRRCRNFKSAALAAPRSESPAPRHEAACLPLARFGSSPLVPFPGEAVSRRRLAVKPQIGYNQKRRSGRRHVKAKLELRRARSAVRAHGLTRQRP